MRNLQRLYARNQPSRTERGRAGPLSPRAHLIYLYILQHTTPRQTSYFKSGELAQALGMSLRSVQRAIAAIKATKPWLTISPRGRGGIAVFWRPDADNPHKPASSPTPPYKDSLKSPINDPRDDRPPPADTWARRKVMKSWRLKSYKDPSMKWALRHGVDIVRIIGHFVWHAQLTLDRVCLAVRHWWNEFLYAGLPLPNGGKPLFQCLFVRLFVKVQEVSRMSII